MAAGLGFKDFTTGEVLTAADVDGYLMQGIWVFASTAARDAAVTSPSEGNFAFTKDTNSLWYYDGAAWVASGAAGDIEGVTAGIGISGGGTSGTVTVTNSMATAIDAKGDLVVGTGADTFSKLTVGANNTVLTADSGEATGLKWQTPASGAPTSATALVSAYQGTTSTSYTDLATAGPAVTLTTGTKALVIMSAYILNDNAGGESWFGCTISGATSITAIDANGGGMAQAVSNEWFKFSVVKTYTSLTAGSNTFTMKYHKDGSGTSNYADREITVIDLGS